VPAVPLEPAAPVEPAALGPPGVVPRGPFGDAGGVVVTWGFEGSVSVPG